MTDIQIQKASFTELRIRFVELWDRRVDINNELDQIETMAEKRVEDRKNQSQGIQA